MLFSGPYTERFQKKHIILTAQLLLAISSAILPFADAPGKYWSRDFPAFVLGAIGGSLLFVNANVAIFHHTPPEIAGTVGAIFNSALQLGSAVGAALITSIELAVDRASPSDSPYRGRAAGFWFLLAIIGAETIAVAFLYRTTPPHDAREPDSDAVTVVDADERAMKKGSSEKLPDSAPLSRCDTMVAVAVADAPPVPGLVAHRATAREEDEEPALDALAGNSLQPAINETTHYDQHDTRRQ